MKIHWRSLFVAAIAAVPALAADRMPAAQQTALVQKYCAVCHTDAAKNGGLSLQHFDAAHASPSLAAMLLSKLTGGVSLDTVRRAPTDASARALVERKAKSGAMGAAGIPVPDKATVDALIDAFAAQSAGATEWSVERAADRAITASIVRESPNKPGEAEIYRLIASCNPSTQAGELQLAWSPVAQSGSLFASVDGATAVQYLVKGSEKMGNGSGLELHGLAALMLTGIKLPAESLTVRDLFPGESVTFPFAGLPKDARQDLQACFAAVDTSNR